MPTGAEPMLAPPALLRDQVISSCSVLAGCSGATLNASVDALLAGAELGVDRLDVSPGARADALHALKTLLAPASEKGAASVSAATAAQAKRVLASNKVASLLRSNAPTGALTPEVLQVLDVISIAQNCLPPSERLPLSAVQRSNALVLRS